MWLLCYFCMVEFGVEFCDLFSDEIMCCMSQLIVCDLMVEGLEYILVIGLVLIVLNYLIGIVDGIVLNVVVLVVCDDMFIYVNYDIMWVLL